MKLDVALSKLLEQLEHTRFPLALPAADEHTSRRTAAAGQIRDYLLPRAATIDAPLLAVVGGSTGAGKSTIVNSLLRRHVTRPGVRRPTTKSPVLICHPSDASWFRSGKVLPELTRTDVELADTRALQIVEVASMPDGLALLDAPDVDSVDDANRTLARQLLLAADLWLFVTSAARYADAVPWGFLKDAAAREMFLGVVINRCPPQTMQEVGSDLARMLVDEGLGAAPLFAIEEGPLDEGMLPDAAVAPIRSWLGGLTSEQEARAQVVKQSLGGALRQLDVHLDALQAGLDAQHQAAQDLRSQATAEFESAAEQIGIMLGDGSMLRGEIVNHWHDVVGTSSLMRGLDEKVASLRSTARRWFRAEPKAEKANEEVSSQLTRVITAAADEACDDVAQAWSRTAWGRTLLTDDLRSAASDFHERAAAAVRGWQQDVLGLVSEQGKGKRFRARMFAFGTNALGLTLMVAVFASTGGLTGAEAGIAGTTSVLSQRVLESVFGAGAVERLTAEARSLLDERVQSLLVEEAARFTRVVDEVSVAPGLRDRLAEAAADVREARAAL
ncbi:MAG: ABC transporter [Propionibacteriaceae bacterium]|nr:ABC transporter [Propionibacteriaceae bacterium]